jgi:hypothetical protein
MSLLGGDLTTLANAQAWIDATPSNAVLTPLISRVSRMILSYLNRSKIIPSTVSEYFNGQGTNQLVPPGWPIMKINSLVVSGTAIPVSPQPTPSNVSPTQPTFSPGFGFPQPGYRVVPWNGTPPGEASDIELNGYVYAFGNQNVVLNYTFGYGIINEPALSIIYTPFTPYGIWASDTGVTYASTGISLLPTTGISPGVGFYVPPSPDAAPPVLNYIFNSTDITTGVLINYGYIPYDLEQACLELIAERASYRKRVGIRSQALAGQETLNYNLQALPDYIALTIQPYVNVIPPAIGADV